MTRSENRAKLAAGGIGLCLTLLAVVFGAVGSLGTFVLTDLLGVSGSDYALLVSSRGIQIGFFAVAISYIWYRGDREPFVSYRLPDREDIAWTAVIPVVLIAFGALFDPVFSAAGIEREAGGSNVDPTATVGLFAVFFLLSWVFAAPAEELLFRGVIQGRLRETFGVISGVAGAASFLPRFASSSGFLRASQLAGSCFGDGKPSSAAYCGAWHTSGRTTSSSLALLTLRCGRFLSSFRNNVCISTKPYYYQ